jgi:cold shock CspA family protein
VTGRIEALSTDDAAGSIRAEDGVQVHFRVSEVTFGDTSAMAVGQLVTFDMERGKSPKAFNIRVEKQHYKGHEKDKLWQAIRYVGFEQTGNVRKYNFERLTPREETIRAVVSVDMALFLKHHIGIQDGPMLCLRLVMAELDSSNASGEAPFRRSLTDHDMQYHLASRPTPEKKRFGRRPGPANTLPPTHAWRGNGPRSNP